VPFPALHNNRPRLASLAAFGQQWWDLSQRAGALGQGGLEAVARFYDPRRLRTMWLSELSLAMDRYMRSPQFLSLLQLNLQALTRPPHAAFRAGLK
jgi:hypothetical protein